MSGAHDPYDPDAPEGQSRGRGSGYATRKDFIIFGIVAAVILIAAYPTYLRLREEGLKQASTGNLKAIFDAAGIYAAENGNRLPPTYEQTNGRVPLLVDGKAVAWPTILEGYISERYNFTDPAATEEENARVLSFNPDKPELAVSYGMYSPMSTYPQERIDVPGSTVLFAETSNYGAKGTLNPYPFIDLDGNTIPEDAFLIGWDNGNLEFDDFTKYVTRLAIYGVENENFSADGVRTRHRGGVQTIMADGRLVRIGPPQAQIEHLPPNLGGIWRNR